MHLAVAAHGMPVGIIVTKGTSADGKQAEARIDGIEAKVLLADRGYDSETIVKKAERPECKRLFHHAEIEKFSVNMTRSCINCGTGLKRRF